VTQKKKDYFFIHTLWQSYFFSKNKFRKERNSDAFSQIKFSAASMTCSISNSDWSK
jgi:hypothetical protein